MFYRNLLLLLPGLLVPGLLVPCLLVPGLLMAAPALSQSAPADTVVALPGITVTATRRPLAIDRSPVRVQLLDRDALATSHSLAEVLDRRAGLFVRRYGSGLASLTMRGGTAAQSLLLLDGLPLSDPQLGQVDLSLIPLFFVDHVEVMHGAASSLYGSDAMAGAIHLQTAAPTEPLAMSVEAGAGPYGERRAGGSVAAARGNWTARVAGEYLTEEGDYPFWNPSLFPAREATRIGADRRQGSLYGQVVRRSGEAHTSLSVLATGAERGLPGPATAAAVGERQWDRQLRLWMAHEQPTSDGAWRVRAGIQQSRLRYANPRLRVDDAGRVAATMLQLERLGRIGRLDWTAGASGSVGRADHPSLPGDAQRVQTALFASGVVEAGRLHLFPSLRLDAVQVAQAWRSAMSPGLGVNVRVLEAAGLSVKGQASTAFRAPTLNDLFWQPGGNPALKPERGRSYEAGLRWHPATPVVRPSAEVIFFLHHTRDQIVWQPVSGSVWSPANVARVRARGVEASAGARMRSGRLALAVEGLYTLTDARDRSDPAGASFNRQVRYVPRHQARAMVDAGWQGADWSVAIEWVGRLTGRRFVTSDESQALDAYAVGDAGVRVGRRIGPGRLRVGANLENALDAAYEGIKGYPMPPRRLVLSAGFVF